MPKTYYPMGSISHGTLRDEDLLQEFASTLDSLATRKTRGRNDTCCNGKQRAAHRKLAKEAYALLEAGEESEGWEFVGEMITELSDALNEYAAPYFYFGSNEGDGSDFGFWLSADATDCAFDGLRVADLSEVPAGYRGEVLLINDHGNTTLLVATRRGLKEIWAVV